MKTILRLPFKKGRLLWTPDNGEAVLPAGQEFMGHLDAKLTRADGSIKDFDLGWGLVTNIGVLCMSNDYNTSSGLNLSTLGMANFHASGTGTTAAAVTDFQLQTPASPTTTTAVTGTQSNASTSGATAIYQTTATINYTSTLSITEWGLFTGATLSSTTGTPFTGTTVSSWTDTGSAQTASTTSVRGLQGYIVVPGTTTVLGLNISNTTHIGTILTNGTTGWFKQSDSTAGSTPGATEAFSIKPVMWDHRVFASIGVNNGDSISYTYKLTINSGG